VVALLLPAIRRSLPSAGFRSTALVVRYPDGRGILRQVIKEVTSHGFIVDDLATEPSGRGHGANGRERDGATRMVAVTLNVGASGRSARW
jgi:hypothetical protein